MVVRFWIGQMGRQIWERASLPARPIRFKALPDRTDQTL
jgi:hypothetical protein